MWFPPKCAFLVKPTGYTLINTETQQKMHSLQGNDISVKELLTEPHHFFTQGISFLFKPMTKLAVCLLYSLYE